jgi:hypothetical protein
MLVSAKVRESFEVYKSSQKTEKQEPIQKEKVSDATLETKEIPAFIQKELDKYYLLIDKIIEKIENLLSVHIQNIPIEMKEKLSNLIPLLRQVKNITNLDKLRLV